MSKGKFTTTDVKAMVRDLRNSLMGKRVANIYDLSDKSYIFKLAVSGESEKSLLLMESGVRFHTTKFTRDLPELPSPFSMKLRKFVKTKRLEGIRQLGEDRVVDFKFGSGDSTAHVILQLHSHGNIVLTDKNYEVAALLRSHQFAEDISLKVGEIYPVAFATNISSVSRLLKAGDKQGEGEEEERGGEGDVDTKNTKEHILGMTAVQFVAWAARICAASATTTADTTEAPATEGVAVTAGTSVNKGQKGSAKESRSRKPKTFTLRQLLLCRHSEVSLYGPEVLEHCILAAGLQPNTKVELGGGGGGAGKLSAPLVDALLDQLRCAPTIIAQLEQADQPGYVILTEQDPSPARDSSGTAVGAEGSSTTTTAATAAAATPPVACSEAVRLVEFVPLLLRQHEGRPHREYPSFDAAVDDYYRLLEEQRLQKEAEGAELAAQRKVDKVRRDQERMLEALSAQQSRMERGAALLEFFAAEVEKASLVINSAAHSGMPWEDIHEMVRTETAAGNPIASLVKSLDLAHNRITLQLNDVYATDSVPHYDDNDENNGDDNSDDNSDNTYDDDEQDDDSCDYFDDSDEDAAGKVPKNRKNQSKRTKKNKNKKTGAPFIPKIEVEIDFTLSAHANARQLYAQKKIASVKEKKTADASEKVLRTVSDQAQKALEKQQLKRNLKAVRKVYWFEKFNWFVTSEGYLVLSGRDAQQNELLFRRYLRSTDVYVHTDVSGASSCIVRGKSMPRPSTEPGGGARGGRAGAGDGNDNGGVGAMTNLNHSSPNSPSQPKQQRVKATSMSPIAIQEAGAMVVCRSTAWKGKVSGVAAWWVWGSQVSKQAMTGEALPVGSFMIYGKKNYLPPMPLEMGFGVMFRLDDGSIEHHLKDWKDKAYLDDAESMSVLTENLDRYDVSFDALGFVDDDPYAGLGGDFGPGPDQDHDHDTTSFTATTVSAADLDTHQQQQQMLQQDSVMASRMAAVDLQTSTIISSVPTSGKKGGKEVTAKMSKSRDKAANKQQQHLMPAAQSGSAKSQKGRGKDRSAAMTLPPQPPSGPAGAAAGGSKKQKHINKKKARRYAEQDEEDKELAMLVLGHTSKSKRGARRAGRQEVELLELERKQQQQDLRLRQKRAGVDLVEEDWAALVALLPEPVQIALNDLVAQDHLQEGEIDASDMYQLASFGEADGLQILKVFATSVDGPVVAPGSGAAGGSGGERRLGNKSAFLSGIMRRFTAEKLQQSKGGEGDDGEDDDSNSSSSSSENDSQNENEQEGQDDVQDDAHDDESSAERKGDEASSSLSRSTGARQSVGGDEASADAHSGKRSTPRGTSAATSGTAVGVQQPPAGAELDVWRMMEEERRLEEAAAALQADEVETLTPCPLPEVDTLLFAVPVCGPYSSLQNFKFRVKLTPGPAKKGRSCKQALELFSRMRECTSVERELMLGITEAEATAIMLGDVKLSMPGLQQLQQAKRGKMKTSGAASTLASISSGLNSARQKSLATRGMKKK